MIHTVCHECGGTGRTAQLRLAMKKILAQGMAIGPDGPKPLDGTLVLGMTVATVQDQPRPCLYCLHGKLPGIVAPV